MEINLTNKAVFVLHVKKGYEDREQHIKAMLQKMNIPFFVDSRWRYCRF